MLELNAKMNTILNHKMKTEFKAYKQLCDFNYFTKSSINNHLVHFFLLSSDIFVVFTAFIRLICMRVSSYLIHDIHLVYVILYVVWTLFGIWFDINQQHFWYGNFAIDKIICKIWSKIAIDNMECLLKFTEFTKNDSEFR